MQAPEIPANEPARLQALRSYDVLDTPAEPAFDALTTLAAHIAGVPIALVSLVDADRQWFKSRYGLDAPETPRDVSFCGHVVATDAPLIVPDAWQDERFADNPLVTGGPRVRFYAGVPLRTETGLVVGTLCTIDHVARELTDTQREMLNLLARQVIDQLELRRKNMLLAAKLREVETYRSELEATLAKVSEARSLVQSILGSANYAIIETTPDGTIREFNAAAERMLGYSASEVIGKVTPMLHVVDEVVARTQSLSAELGIPIEPSFETIVAMARWGIPDENEWTYVRKDGSRFPVDLSVTARRAPNGDIVGFVGIARDVSARKRAEAKLRESEVRLEAVFAGMAEGVVIHDRTGAIKEANAAAERILGLSRDQLLGRAPGDARWVTKHPDGSPFPGEQHPAMVTLRTGEPQQDVIMAVAKASGEQVLVSINSEPLQLFSDSSAPDAVVATFRDITLQARTEQALVEQRLAVQESETRLRSIIDTAVDAMITINERGLIERVNPAVEKLFGYAPSELLGGNVKVLMPSPDHEQHDGYLANYVKTGARKVIGIGREVTAGRKDGTTFPAELAVSEFFLAGQRHFTGVIRDISDRKRVERMQSEFVSTVSHELRTPLTSIRGSLGLISGGVLGEIPKEAKEYVDIALSNSDRLVRLINDILDMEKMRSGSMDFRLQATDLGAAVRSAMAANEGFAASHQTGLTIVGEIPAGEVLVDPDRLAQVLTNLLSNAAKFSPPGAQVELSAERIGERFRVSIRDHGPGIPKEFEGRIFERFSQADASSTRQKGGTGLGLNITKAIVEKMRGRVGFQPAEGGGTVFFFDLPYLHPVLSEGPAAPTASRVLVCEDDPDVSRLLETLLCGAGYVVHVAPTLERARRLLSQNKYDAITLDLVLADGEGSVLIAELRGAPATRQIPIIVVSGSNRQLGAAAVLVSAVIVKPFDETSLLAAVATALLSAHNAIPRLLHVEDDPDIRRIVRKTLPAAWEVISADSLRTARHALAEGEFDLVLLDLSLPDGRGDELLGLMGGAQVIIFSALDASAELSRRVSAALVKSRSTQVDVRDKIISLISGKGADASHTGWKEAP